MQKITIIVSMLFIALNTFVYADSWTLFTNGKIDSFEINLEQIAGKEIGRYYMLKWQAEEKKCSGITANPSWERKSVIIKESLCIKMKEYLNKNKASIISYSKANPIFPKYIPRPNPIGKLSFFGKEFKVNMMTNATCDSDDNCVEPVLSSVDKLASFMRDLLTSES